MRNHSFCETDVIHSMALFLNPDVEARDAYEKERKRLPSTTGATRAGHPCLARRRWPQVAGAMATDSGTLAVDSGTPVTTPPQVVAKKPNILFIMADDLARTWARSAARSARPTLTRWCDGRILTNHHTAAVCAVTRSMIISGTDHHLVGQGTMANSDPNYVDENGKPVPGYEGYLNDRALSIAQLLKDGGYHTYMAGKWHLGSGLPNATNQGAVVGTSAPADAGLVGFREEPRAARRRRGSLRP
jgi:arylsulfatase